MKGLYIHIPFCKEKCKYCDFCSIVSSYDKRKEYVENLLKEFDLYGGKYDDIETIFIGGGTPSVLDIDLLRMLLDKIKSLINVERVIEYTVECNPGTITEELADLFLESGVNRISLGLQSTSDRLLKVIGRIHSYNDFKESYYLLRKKGIKNINVDFIYGLPGQTVEDIEADINEITKLNPEHISYYSLKIEEGTKFYQMYQAGEIEEIDEEIDRAMYHITIDKLKALGYGHYEISNFSKPGHESVHNLKYWRCHEYIGLGLSAHGYLDGYRYSNYYDFNEYYNSLSSNEKPILDSSEISGEDLLLERIMLGLRLREGISIAELNQEFDIDFLDIHGSEIEKHEEMGYMKIKDGRLFLTDSGFDISNYIISKFI